MKARAPRGVRHGRVVLALLIGCGPVAPLHGQPAQTVLSPSEYLGYELGERFTPHGAIRGYASALAERSDRVSVQEYGRTVEGRELIQVVITSAAHHARLQEILSRNAELTRGGVTEARAREIAADNPAIVYFSYGVHGNETSSSEAAMWTAYDLARGAPELAGVLDSLVVVIDPVANPDGRERYVSWYRSVVGAEPNADPQSREHREPWPGGRTNHYLFDLNRDWAWMTQPETRARLATWWRWNPQVHVDFHEMSPTSTYFFFPAAAPINPIYPAHILAWGRRFGEANARAFDERGWTYFTGESFDLLYPGYGDTWPSLLGAVGMTYEQAGGGSAGLRYARAPGDTLTLEHRATQHRVAGSASLRTAAAGKTRLLLDFAEAHRTAGEGQRDFLLVPGRDPSRLQALVDHLLAQGIEVERAQSQVRLSATPYPGFASRRDFPAGTVLVRARQPRGRLAVTLLQAETELRAEYSYDISAWSLPYAYGVEAHRSSPVPAAGWVRATPSAPTSASHPLPATSYGYLVAPARGAAPAVLRYLAAGGAVRVLARATRFGGQEWPAGSWFLPAAGPGADRQALEASGVGEFASAVAGGLSESGIDLGSAYALPVRLPRIAVLSGEGVVASSFGAHWYHLEQELGIAFDAVLLSEVTTLDLSRYGVIILPEMGGELTESAREVLRRWVESGGRLIAVGGSAEAAAPIAEVELRQPSEETDDSTELDRLLATREERERQAWREEIPGAILPVRIDPGHPLAWGAGIGDAGDRLFVLHTEGRVFEPRSGAEAVGFFGVDLRATSGVVSAENLRRLERGSWLLSREVGSGRVILFADDPLFRLFWQATKPLYLNAILYGDM